MQTQMNTWQNLSGEAFDEWFLNQLADCVVNFDQLLAAISRFQEVRQLDKAEACAGLLQDALMKHPAGEQLLRLLEKRAAWQSKPEDYAAACFNALAAYFKGRNLMQLYLSACGLKNGVHPQEALRRLRVLSDLKPGKYCYGKAWGVGKVSGMDEFDRQIIVDFEKKKSHRLAFAYAGETLQPLKDDHFLALKLRDPAALQRWLAEKQAEAVKAMLNQFGEMTAGRLRDLVVSLLIPEDKWNSFWSAARQGLASDPLVQMPSNRDEPIRLLSAKREFNGEWLDAFARERDPERIFAEVEELYVRQGPQNLGVEFGKAVAYRLTFAARSASKRRYALVVQALLLADAAGLDLEQIFDAAQCVQARFLLETLDEVPARFVGPLLDYLGRKKCLPALEAVADIVPEMPAPIINEFVSYYRRSGGEKQWFDMLRAGVQAGRISVAMTAWLGRNLRLACEHEVCRPEFFAQTALSLLKTALAERDRKDINQLLAIFTDPDLMQELLEPMDRQHRLDFCGCLYTLTGLTLAEQKKIAAKIVPLFPDLASAFSDGAQTAAAKTLWTSLRSYRAKQAQLEKIIREEIPNNSREIGVARSYGDLRENFEYKAAKETQGILMRRKADLEKMLGEVKSTDFAGFPNDVAGQGSSVELKMPDGVRKIYHILGEWDSDENFCIISCRSKLAEILKGHRAGDTVEIPGENAPVSCVIEGVRELPPEIRAWINGG